MADEKLRADSLDIVPRRLDLGLPRLDRQLAQKLQTRHHHFDPADPVHPGWVSHASQHHIRAMTFDNQRGWVWLATWGGILCWQPQENVCLRHTSEHGLPGNATRRIVADTNSNVWAVAENNGLCTLNPDRNEGWRIQGGDIGNWTVIDLFPKPEGGIYVTLQDAHGQDALGKIDAPGSELKILIHGGLTVKAVAALTQDDHGTLWLGNPWGLHRYHNGETRSFKLDNAQIRALTLGVVDSLWVGTNRGLYRFLPDQDPPHIRDAGWPQDEVVAVATEPESGDVWLITAREVGRIFDNVWQPARQKPPGQTNGLLFPTRPEGTDRTAYDRFLTQGQTWISGTHGLHQVGLNSTEAAFTFDTEDSLSNAVQTLYVDETGVWVGAARGLFHFDGHHWRSHTAEVPALRDVRAILPGSETGRLWVGSWRSGLHRFQTGVHLPDRNLSQPIVALTTGANGIGWAATLDQIYGLQPGNQTWQPVPHPLQEHTAGEIITAMCHQTVTEPGGEQGSIVWVGTTGGLFYYRPGLGLWDRVLGELEDSTIQALAVDPQTNQLWVGTANGLFSEARWQRHRDSNVQSLAFCSTTGKLWLGTTAGLEIWPAPGQAQVFGSEPDKHLTIANSGLAANRVTALAFRATAHGQEVWIGTPAGLSCYIDPN